MGSYCRGREKCRPAAQLVSGLSQDIAGGGGAGERKTVVAVLQLKLCCLILALPEQGEIRGAVFSCSKLSPVAQMVVAVRTALQMP